MKKGTGAAKASAKKGLFFGFFKKHKALAVSLIVAATAAASFLVVNYGRYVKEIIEVYYLRTKNFYFNSDKLTINGKTYEINPWPAGDDPYEISISMNTLLNSLKGTNGNVVYQATCEPDSKTICYFDTRSTTQIERTIPATSHTDVFTVKVEKGNNVQLKNGDVVSVTIKAKSTSPYEEELKATFKLKVGNYGVYYSIDDQSGRLYFDALVSNTTPNLTKRIKLTITEPNNISIDMSNNILAVNTTQKTTTQINGHDYITAITFDVAPKSSIMVRYYKKNTAANYTSDGTGSPIVSFQEIE